MARILIVENDVCLAATLRRTLLRDHHRVWQTGSLGRTYELLADNAFDVVMVDRLLDDGDGLELAPFISQVSPSTKLIFLTNKHELVDRLTGLRSGADDYLAKPFAIEELQLKIAKLVQMEKSESLSYVKAGSVTLYPETGALMVADRPGRLRKREAEILSCLLRFQGRVVSRQMLIERVWKTDQNIPTHTTLDVYIRRLRILLGPQAGLIKTIRGFGYMVKDGQR